MAKQSSSYEFKWNYSIPGVVQRKGFGTELNRLFAKTLVDYSDGKQRVGVQLTPEKTGELMNSVKISANNVRGTIQYTIPYFKYQYYADDSGWHRHTPTSKSYWLQLAWRNYKRNIISKVEYERRRLSK